jgi:hypothetical protein
MVAFDLGKQCVVGPAVVQQISTESRYEQNDEVEPNQIASFRA